jgi:FtsP/CotA-like multicopper oxidase with cupredoxin domain
MQRRDVLKAMLLTGASAAISPALPFPGFTARAATQPRGLRAVSRTIDVNGRAASVFGLQAGEGRSGLTFTEGEAFRVDLRNDLAEPTLIHWHGMRPPFEQDGVPDNPLPLLRGGEVRAYDFPVGRAGTHWMHAHTLQEQKLLAAPLIVRDREAASRDEQEVVILLHDFSFKQPEELLAQLQGPGGRHNMDGGQGMGAGSHGMHGPMRGMDGPMDHMMGGTVHGGMGHGGGMHANDIDYDAYLANDRTLADPEVVTVEKGGRIRLRIINGATATAFTIDTGALEGELIAVDGQDIAPLRGRLFPIAMGQRLDIRLALPAESRAFPILALREDATERTGIFLAASGAKIGKLAQTGDTAGPAVGLDLERRLAAAAPLPPRRADRVIPVMLSGGIMGYAWSMSAPGLTARKGERVHLIMQNYSMMAHPMHLHGHHFQVIGINGAALSGAVRDTVHIPPMAHVTVAFDADAPGRWAFHCHHLYHMAAGMMAMLEYQAAG